MSEQMEPGVTQDQSIGDQQNPSAPGHRKREIAIKALVILAIFILGAGSGYLFGDRLKASVASTNNATGEDEAMNLMHQINPPEGYKMPVIYGDIGPQLVEAGAIDMPRFTSVYKQQAQPLTDEQMAILTKGSVAHVEINPENAYFLLNFFWAFGLTNQNSILTEGKMVSRGIEQVGGFASTGGWTLGTKPATDLYASRKIIPLTDEQQARLAEVAAGVYRPCCNNPTDFPDCNHGMAMLGLEVATAIQADQNVDFAKADAQLVVSSQFSSGSGFQAVHQWLSGKGLLQQAPSGGGSCGVQ
jgi:hypothetical protein